MMWASWWIWVAGGLLVGVLELLVPGYIFLGFAVGAIVTGVLTATGILGTSLPIMLVAFGTLSLLTWVGLRSVLGLRRGQVKRIDRDINEN